MAKEFVQRVIGGIIKTPPTQSSKVGPEEHDRIFREFLNTIDQDHPDTVKFSLFKNYEPDGSYIREPVFAIPELWMQELLERVAKKSVMYPHLKNRTTTSDRLLQPTIISPKQDDDSKPTVNWGNVNQNLSIRPKPKEEPKKVTRVVEDYFTTIEVEKSLKKFIFDGVEEAVKNHNLNDAILDSLSTQIAEYIDQNVVAIEIPERQVLDIITLNDSVMGHKSNGLGTVAGYIELDLSSSTAGDAFVAAYDHLPDGYRNHSNWYMNEETAELVKTMKITPTEKHQHSDLVENPSSQIDTDKNLIELLGRPVVINKYMQNTGLIAFIADLSRGYVFAKPNTADAELRIGSDSATEGMDVAALKIRIGGQVLQPATMKFVKLKE